MSRLTIVPASDTSSYRPGERVEGTFLWELDEEPEKITLGLHWLITRKSDDQSGMVDCVELERPGCQGSGEYSFEIPSGPYSFRGRFWSLGWVLELAESPGTGLSRVPITVSPTGEAIDLSEGESQ